MKNILKKLGIIRGTKIHSFLVLFKPIYGFIKPPVRSYSQKGEDLLVDAFFNRRSNGYYLDIGCFHPKWVSNTHLFHKKGWSGTVVDIDKFKLKWFKRFRKSKVNIIHSAVVDKPKGISVSKVYKFIDHGISLIDTLDIKTAEDNRLKGWGEFKIEEINTIDINTLLDSLPHVNFLNIDVEGMDSKIVSSIDLTKYKIDLILFEDTQVYGGTKILTKKLEGSGYFHLFTSGGSVCYALQKNS